MNRILCVEDNDSYRELLVSELREVGYKVDGVDSPLKGLEMLVLNRYDLVISDLKLPVMSGVAFMESVKNVSPDTLGIILTGDPDEESELQSIRTDVDLYIEKTRSLSIIIEYINKLIDDNSKELPKAVYIESRSENIKINAKEHSVYKDGKEIDLTPKEYEILKLFLLNPNKVMSREEILDKVWHESIADVDLRIVDSHIKKLRDKIKSFSIVTVRGYGYKWSEIEEE